VSQSGLGSRRPHGTRAGLIGNNANVFQVCFLLRVLALFTTSKPYAASGVKTSPYLQDLRVLVAVFLRVKLCDVMTSLQTSKLKWIVESYSSRVFNQNPPFLDCIALKNEALRSFEKPVNIYLIS
jgi:hypothetical protein